MNVALCTFFCVQRHIHTLARDSGAATDDANEEKGASGAAFREPLIIGSVFTGIGDGLGGPVGRVRLEADCGRGAG